MKPNENISDRIVRVMLGLAIGYMSFTQTSDTTVKITLMLMAFILLISGLTGFSMIYSLFHLDNSPNAPPKSENREATS